MNGSLTSKPEGQDGLGMTLTPRILIVLSNVRNKQATLVTPDEFTASNITHIG